MLSRLSLMTTLMVGAIVVALVPLAVLAIGTAQEARELTVSGALHRDELLAKGLAAEYEEFLSLRLKAVATTAAHAAAVEPFGPATLGPLLARTHAHYPLFATMLVVDATGATATADPPTAVEGQGTPASGHADRAWFRQMVQTRQPLVDRTVIVGKTTEAPIVVLAAPILDRAGRFRGAVAAELRLQEIQTSADRIRLGETGYAQVTTADGHALAHRDRELVRQRFDYSRLPIWPLVSTRESGQIRSYVAARGDLRLAGFATVPISGWKVWVSRALSDVDAEVLTIYRDVAGWVGLALAGAVVLAVALAVTLARPIRGLRTTATAIAGGELGQQAPEQGPKDTVALARAFNRMAGMLRQMVEAERDAKGALEQAVRDYGALAARVMRGDLTARATTNGGGGPLRELATNLNRMIEGLASLVAQIGEAAGNLASASAEILAATTQQAAGVAEESTAVQETSTTVEEVKQTAQVAADKARAVADAALKSAQTSQDGRRAVDDTVASMGEAKSRMEALAQRILALSEQAQAIADLNAAVSDLAEQSNLLAVNAAIEAAKAGDAGRGFAVVAAEVKALADQSKQATLQVRQLLADIQRATHAAVMAAEQGVKTVDQGSAVAASAGTAIRLLAGNVQDAAQAAQQIVASAQQQLAGMDQVALAMHGIRQASAQNLAATRQVEQAARDLDALARRLTTLVGTLRNGAGASP
jgi:methyl-accepting chemotaxis protein